MIASTADLAPRILAEIERVENAARAATPGPWTVDANHYTGYCAISTPTIGGGIVSTGTHGGGCEQREDAEHIARNNPKAVLRRCAADRRIVERYVTCYANSRTRGDSSTLREQTKLLAYEAALWDLADGYGITVDGAE